MQNPPQGRKAGATAGGSGGTTPAPSPHRHGAVLELGAVDQLPARGGAGLERGSADDVQGLPSLQGYAWRHEGDGSALNDSVNLPRLQRLALSRTNSRGGMCWPSEELVR